MSDFFEKVKPFMIGSMSGMIATTVIQPIDTIKVLIQLKKADAGKAAIDSPITIAKNQIASKGFLSLYSGLDAALMRQLVYTGMRLGLYKSIEDTLREQRGGRNLGFMEKTLYSMLAGLIGSFMANPVDLSLVRMQADNNLP
jgi:solute carrier family 25 oxoglutarate transporter 11